MPNPSILNFGMKLRNYKNTTTYNAPQPWLYPAKKVFHPSYVYEGNLKDKVSSKLVPCEFTDQSPDRN